MSTTVVTNVGELVTNDPQYDGPLGILRDAAFVVEDGKIAWLGSTRDAPDADERQDVAGAAVIPGFVDSHTHLAFAGDRSVEFSARMMGEPYTAGGIRTTVAATRAASDAQLHDLIAGRLQLMAATGTTTMECKSGYGLSTHDESRSLQVASAFTEETTFLGAHVVPQEYQDKPDDYVDLVCGPMLAACAPHAKWVDVFCDRGAFTPEQTRRILTASVAAGLRPRLHANQLGPGEGVRVAVEFGAASADHLTYLTAEDVDLLAHSDTVATLLPGVEFSTRSPYPNARELLDAGATVALASDCNPGSCYVTSIPFVIALAVREMRMSPAEALWSATAGGARALRRDDVGHLGVGARADFAVLDAPSHLHLAYRPGTNLISRVNFSSR
jgi:imidazolonepropionase